MTITTILGYETDQLQKICNYYIFKNKKDPETLWDIIIFWKKSPKHDVDDVLKLGFEIVESENNKCDFNFTEMLERFINKNPYSGVEK